MKNQKPVIIFSVFQDGLTNDANKKNHEQLKELMTKDGYSFKELVSSNLHQGYPIKRDSFLVVVPSNLDKFCDSFTNIIFTDFKQNNVLYSDANRSSYLIDILGNKVSVGRLLEVSKEKAEYSKNYLYCDKIDKYWMTV